MKTRRRFPWQEIQWIQPQLANRPRDFSPLGRAGPDEQDTAAYLRAALNALGRPTVPRTTPLVEAQTLLHAASEVEHALLVEYLYAAWSLGGNAIARRIIDIAIQEMSHFITVQNLLLFTGANPSVQRTDQDTSPALDPFAFTLRPFSQSVLEDFLLTEMPSQSYMTANQLAIMKPIILRHGESGNPIHPVGVIYAQLYWLFQADDQPTSDWPEIARCGFKPGRHIPSFPGQETEKTFQADFVTEVKWHAGDARGGVLETIASREAALKALFEIAAQGEGLVAASAQQSHFETFLDIYTTTDFSHFPSTAWPTDPFVSDQAASDPTREANRITNPAAAALCGVLDLRYQIALTSIRAALSRERTNPDDLAVRAKYIGYAFDEMLGFIKGLALGIARLPCKQTGQAGALNAGPVFGVTNFTLPDDAAGLDTALLTQHRNSETAIAAALPLVTDAGMRVLLNEMQQTDNRRFPNLVS
jgi:hypothetical protein